MDSHKKVVCRDLMTPVGQVILGAMGNQLCLCDWKNSKRRETNDNRVKRLLKVDYVDAASVDDETKQALLVLRNAKQQLDEYFSGKRDSFDIPLLMAGTDFQKSVWQALLEIPYGATVSYMDIAEKIGNPKGVRAVAQAIGSNPLAIFIPCHRVVGSNGKLTGFAGGLDAKTSLLALEQNQW